MAQGYTQSQAQHDQSGIWRIAAGPAQQLLANTRVATTAATLQAATPVAIATPGGSPISRRSFLLGTSWTGLGLAVATTLSGLDFLFPRKIVGFGGPIAVPAEQIPAAGSAPVRFIKGKFWLANLQANEGIYGDLGEAGKWRSRRPVAEVPTPRLHSALAGK